MTDSAPGVSRAAGGAPRQRSRFLSAAILLFAIALLGWVAAPFARTLQQRARARATVAELKAFCDVFVAYAHRRGDWPPSSPAPGEAPPELADALKRLGWSRSTPLGGRYVWLADSRQRGQRVPAAIALVSLPQDQVANDEAQLQALLAAAESSGMRQLRLGFRNEPVLALEP